MFLDAKIKKFLDGLNDLAFVVDPGDGSILFANQRALETLGYPAEEIASLQIEDLYPLEMARLSEFFQQVQKEDGGTANHLHFLKKSGQILPAEISARPMEEDGRPLILATVRIRETGPGPAKPVSPPPGLGPPGTVFQKEQYQDEIVSLSKLPYENPFPVMRFSLEGEVVYANPASLPLLKLWGRFKGRALPPDLRDHLTRASCSNTPILTRMQVGDQTLQMVFNRVPGENYINVYGQDITSLLNTKKALRAARDEAERANRAKSEFLGRMSHELRTPLNAVIGFAQLLAFNAGKNLTESDLECVDHIAKAGRHLLNLVNEVLDLVRIESGEINLVTEKVALQPLVEELVALSIPEADSRQVQLEVTGFQSQDMVLTDKTRLKQILLNLLSNAIKYNREPGRVTVSLERPQPDWLALRVADTGNGIPPDRLDRLFEPFDRLGFENTGEEGAGIGLLITQNLVKELGGRLEIESRVNVGSCFTVHLPGKTPTNGQVP